MDGRYQAPPFAGDPSRTWVSPHARVEEGAVPRLEAGEDAARDNVARREFGALVVEAVRPGLRFPLALDRVPARALLAVEFEKMASIDRRSQSTARQHVEHEGRNDRSPELPAPG